MSHLQTFILGLCLVILGITSLATSPYTIVPLINAGYNLIAVFFIWVFIFLGLIIFGIRFAASAYTAMKSEQRSEGE